VEHYDKGVSEDGRRVDIDGLEEARCAALVQSARCLPRCADATMTATSRNAPSMLTIRPPSHPEHGRTTKAKVPLGRPLHSRKGDRAGLLPPPDT
jgi:hypothetical protein